MKFTFILLVLTALGTPARAVDFPDWAYPPVPNHQASADPTLLRVPDSPLSFTQGQIDSGYEVADWYPNEHPPMPRVVSNGAQPPVRACAMCHLPSGAGHPESASLAGLTAEYLNEQMRAFVNGTRTGGKAGSMIPIASGMTEAETRESSAYFAALPHLPWSKVIETDTVPQSFLGLGAVRYRVPGGTTEPLGQRIISLPQDDQLALRRDSHSGFIAYVPPGSIARGQALVEAPSSVGQCAACHGVDLRGSGDVPGLSGRLPLPAYRSMNDIKMGLRTTHGALSMKPSVVDLSSEDMIAIAAYLASLPP